MAAPTNIEAMPVVRDLKDFDLNSGNRLERLIFNHRAAVMLACLVVTVVLGYLAVQVSLGVSNVLLHLPLAVAVAHNAGGAALLLVLVLINYRLRAHPLAAHSREPADLAATRFAPLGK